MPAHPVVVSGASGLIGSALVAALRSRGTPVIRLVRRAPEAPDERQWTPGGRLDPATLAGARAVVNLNGASIGRLPWTPRYRRILRASRIDPTRTLARAIRELGPDAPALLSASAVGYYGSRPGQRLDEGSGAGRGFLAQLCVEWEQVATSAVNARVALLRTAPLIDRDGVLKPLISLTGLGLGGPLGDGRQVWPWLTLADEVGAILHVLDSDDIEGPVNLTGPSTATATQIGRALAHEIHRPFLLPAPAWALRAAVGRDAANDLLLVDADVRPTVLTRTGYVFAHPTAQQAVQAALRAPKSAT